VCCIGGFVSRNQQKVARQMDESLFKKHRAWAEGIGRSVKRGLPPSFDTQELEHIAVIQHWKCVEAYNPARNDNYRAYAYAAIHGAVLMSCRRREYRESTHEELPGFQVVDPREGAEVAMLRTEARRNVSGPLRHRRLVKVRAALASLAPADAYLIRRIYLDGGDETSLCELWHMDAKALAERLRRAVAKLKKAVNG
jgi:RNA polymerase sigma factor (sigma-70 family)